MVGMPPYRNQTQATPHQGGQYCKKSYVGGDNNIERTQARRRAPTPPRCVQACVYLYAKFACLVITSDNPYRINRGIQLASLVSWHDCTQTRAWYAWRGGSDLQAWQTCTQTMICFTCVKQKSMTGQKCFYCKLTNLTLSMVARCKPAKIPCYLITWSMFHAFMFSCN